MTQSSGRRGFFNKTPARQQQTVPEHQRLGVTPQDQTKQRQKYDSDFKLEKARQERQNYASKQINTIIMDAKTNQDVLVDQINSESFLEDVEHESLNSIPDFGYVMFHNGEFIASFADKSQVEEFLEQEVLKENSQYDPNFVVIMKKIPFKFGFALTE